MTRRRADRPDGFPITVDDEVADFMRDGTLHEEMYVWTLCPFLLPNDRHASEAIVRTRIEAARECEARFWQHWPGGPEPHR